MDAPLSTDAAHAAVLFAFGDELRQARKARGWTRRVLRQELLTREVDISIQTLATYELGTRHCSVARLFELCRALDVSPGDLVARAHQRVNIHDTELSLRHTGGRLAIDLERVVRDQQSELVSLRAWASERVGHDPRKDRRIAYLGIDALENMANLCGLSTPDLIAHLQAYKPSDPTVHSLEHRASA